MTNYSCYDLAEKDFEEMMQIVAKQGAIVDKVLMVGIDN